MRTSVGIEKDTQLKTTLTQKQLAFAYVLVQVFGISIVVYFVTLNISGSLWIRFVAGNLGKNHHAPRHCATY